MKTFPTTALMLAAMLSLASADVIDLTTTNGRTYKQCRIVKMETDGVSFRHANGAGKVLFKDLTKDLREHFDYDPVRAQAHEEKLKADKAKARAETLKKAEEVFKAHQEAVNRALEKQALNALTQALAQAQANQGTNSFVTLTGSQWNAPLGPVFESQHDYRNSGRFRSPALNWCGQAVGQFHPGGHNRGFTPRSFFAVPGLGPNYVPQPVVPCVPRH
jgi:hypothetical protein